MDTDISALRRFQRQRDFNAREIYGGVALLRGFQDSNARNILTRGRLQLQGDFNTGEFNAATMSMLGRFQRQGS